jgi:cell division protease FtsH
MVTRWGMSERVGPVSLAPRDNPFLAGGDVFAIGEQKPYSEATGQLIDAEVRRILDDCYAAALELLRANRPRLDTLAAALLDHETLDEQDIRRVTGITPELAIRSDRPTLPAESPPAPAVAAFSTPRD